MIERLRKFLGVQTLEEKIYEYQALQESLSLVKSKLDDLVEDYHQHTNLYKSHISTLTNDIRKGKSGSESLLGRIKDRYSEYFTNYISEISVIKSEIEEKNSKLSKLLTSDENLEKAVKQYELEENFSIVKNAYKLGKVSRDVLEKAIIETGDLLEKAKVGIYQNTYQNRKLGRVGQKYGEEKKQNEKDDIVFGGKREENFKKWFGNSKAVDKDGKPMILYHGTTASEDFTEFKGDRMFFTDNKELANEFVTGLLTNDDRPRIIPVYLKIENPYLKSIRRNTDITEIKKEGYDGAIFIDSSGNKQFVVFSSNQIKSATGNKGTFDSESNDITKSLINDFKIKKTKYADCIIRDKEGRFLFLKRNENSDFQPGVLCLGGGHVDPGEKFEEAAKRECEEETGLKVESCQLVGTYEDDNSIIKYFECTLENSDNPFKKEQEIFLHGNEHSQYFWLTREEYLKEDLILNLKDVLEEIYGDEIRKNEIRKAFSLLEEANKRGMINDEILQKAISKYGQNSHIEKVKVQGKDGKVFYRDQKVGGGKQLGQSSSSPSNKDFEFTEEQLDSYARETPKEKLETIIKNSGNAQLREAAHKELKRRSLEEEGKNKQQESQGTEKQENKQTEDKQEEKPSKQYNSFKGNVEETIEANKEGVSSAKEDLKKFISGSNTLSDKTIDMLATLGAVTTPKDMLDLMKNKEFQDKIMKDLETAVDSGEEKKTTDQIDTKDVEVEIPDGGGTVKVKHKGKDVAFDDLKLVVDGKEAFIPKVKKKEGEAKGMGTAAYIKIGQELEKKGIKLVASDALYADGHKMWQRLVKQGYAKKVGNSYEFSSKEKGKEIFKSLITLYEAVELGSISHDIIEKAESKYGVGKRTEKIKVEGKDGKNYYRSQQVGRNYKEGDVDVEDYPELEGIQKFAETASEEELGDYIKNGDNEDFKELARKELLSRGKKHILIGEDVYYLEDDKYKEQQSRFKKEKLGEDAKSLPESELSRHIKEHEDGDYRAAAHQELERRKKEEYPQKEEVDGMEVERPKGDSEEDKEVDANQHFNDFYESIDELDDKEFIDTIKKRFKTIFPKIDLGSGWKKDHVNILKNFEKMGTNLPNGHIRNNDMFKGFENHSTMVMPIYAYYNKADKIISLSDKLIEKAQVKGDLEKENEFNASMTHELGHTVENKLKETDNKKFIEFGKACGWSEENASKFASGTQQDVEREGKFDLLTKYANKSTGEAFAEYYSMYALNKHAIDSMIDGEMTWNINYRNQDISSDDMDKNIHIFKWMRKNVWENEELSKAMENDIIKSEYTKDQLKELIEEHEQLVSLLSKYKDKDDIKEELDKQIKELEDYKKSLKELK